MVTRARIKHGQRPKVIEELRLHCEVVMGGPSEKIEKLIEELDESRHVPTSAIQIFSDLIWEAR